MNERALAAAAAAVTVRTVDSARDPTGVEQPRTYAKVPVVVGVTVLVPCGGCGPLHAPLATQAVTLFDDQLRAALCPKVMVLGLTVMARFGATGSSPMGNEPWVLKEQLTKAEACA
jgi:hypothetical protein